MSARRPEQPSSVELVETPQPQGRTREYRPSRGRQRWACSTTEDVDDLRAAAQSAYLTGHRDEAVDLYQRAFRLSQDAGDPRGGIACAFHLSMIFGTGGEPALSSGWTTRAERLLDELGPDVAEAGYVSFLLMYRDLSASAWAAAAEKADATADAGRRHGDQDLVALGLVAGGRIAIYSGRAAEGITRLDEAMAAVAAGEVSPEVFGNVYCIAIEGCQEIRALDRVAEWTSALDRWCSSQPSLVAFTGQCSVHRGQVMRQQGAWADAIEEFTRAGERYRLANSLDAIGQAEGERGDVLRLQGEYAEAEAAYQRAGEHGFDPQPGLASAVAGARLAPTPRAPPYAGWWRRSTTRPASAGCSRPPSTSCSPSGRSTRRRPSPPSWTRSHRPSARAGCWPPRRTPRPPWSWPPATRPARCPTCARPASSGRGSSAPTRSPGSASSPAARSPRSATTSRPATS